MKWGERVRRRCAQVCAAIGSSQRTRQGTSKAAQGAGGPRLYQVHPAGRGLRGRLALPVRRACGGGGKGGIGRWVFRPRGVQAAGQPQGGAAGAQRGACAVGGFSRQHMLIRAFSRQHMQCIEARVKTAATEQAAMFSDCKQAPLCFAQ